MATVTYRQLKKPGLLGLVFFFLFLSLHLVGASTLSLDDTICINGQTLTATMHLEIPNEKGRAYTVEVWNTTNTSAPILLDDNNTGTTPSDLLEPFFASYICPNVGTLIGNFTLVGINLEGTEDFSMEAPSGNDLIIGNFSITSECLVGKTCGVEFFVVDENGKTVSGASCVVDIEDGDGVPITTVNPDIVSHDGKAIFSGVTSIIALSEGRGFILNPSCICGVSPNGCWNEDGGAVVSHAGGSSFAFSISSWLLNVSTGVDKPSYVPGDSLFICPVMTSPENRPRIGLEIKDSYRCSDGNDTGYDRVIIDSHTTTRGISGNITQTQCSVFVVPDAISIEQNATICYADSAVTVLDELGNPLVKYEVISSVFNINTPRIHPRTVWQRTSPGNYQGNATTSEFDVGVKEVHFILSERIFGGVLTGDDIKSFNVTYGNGSGSFSTKLVTHSISLVPGIVKDEVMVVAIGIDTDGDDVLLVNLVLEGFAQEVGTKMMIELYVLVPIAGLVLMLLAFVVPSNSDKIGERIILSMGSMIFFAAGFFLTENLTIASGGTLFSFDARGLRGINFGLSMVMVVYSIWSFILAWNYEMVEEPKADHPVNAFEEDLP